MIERGHQAVVSDSDTTTVLSFRLICVVIITPTQDHAQLT